MRNALRVILFLILLVAGAWGLFSVARAEREGVVFHLPFYWAWPSTKPLPVPWQGQDRLALESDGPPAPGSLVLVRGGGFPASAPVRVGLGLSQAGFQILSEGQADAGGAVALAVTIPPQTARGQSAFFLVTTRGMPAHTAISDLFVIE